MVENMNAEDEAYQISTIVSTSQRKTKIDIGPVRAETTTNTTVEDKTDTIKETGTALREIHTITTSKIGGSVTLGMTSAIRP